MKPKISVIVPIYNTEKYLDKCLQSIINQTMQEIEIICIDDCSPDDSYLIVEKFMEQDSRVSLIRHEKNKGSGGARNTGILAAKANFLASVDSDDHIKPEMMQILWEASEDGRYDVVCCGYDCVDQNGTTLSSFNLSHNILKAQEDDIDIFSTVNPAFWNKLWRKSLFTENDITFPEKIYYEDSATTPRLISKATVIRTIETNLYLYLTRSDSITNTYSKKHLVDYFACIEIIFEHLKVNNLLKRHGNSFLDYINRSFYNHSKDITSSCVTENEANEYLWLLLQKKYFYISKMKCPIASPRELLSTTEMVSLLMPINELSLAQRLASSIFGFIFKPFMGIKQHQKLLEDPRSFFKDSKNNVAQIFGEIFELR